MGGTTSVDLGGNVKDVGGAVVQYAGSPELEDVVVVWVAVIFLVVLADVVTACMPASTSNNCILKNMLCKFFWV
jgi:hypothetical protein